MVLLPYFLFLSVFWEPNHAQLVCPKRDEAFELVTGYVFTSPDTILDTRPGVLKLEDCIETCRRNSSCWSVNYETGLCVLFSSSAENTPGKVDHQFFICLVNLRQMAQENTICCYSYLAEIIRARNRKFALISFHGTTRRSHTCIKLYSLKKLFSKHC